MTKRHIVAGAFICAAVAGPAHAGSGVTLTTEQDADIGRYLTLADGTSVYLFKKDSANTSTCHDNCADVWPPVTTDDAPTASDGAKSGHLGTITRDDGATQVTYNGWPLYTFVKDGQPGDIEGQDVEGFGAEWYLVTPDGETAHGEDHHDDDH